MRSVAAALVLDRKTCVVPRFAVLNQQPHDPVEIRNGSLAPVSAMYRACPVEPVNCAAEEATPLIPVANVTPPLFVNALALPDTSDMSLRFHRPRGADSPIAVKSETTSWRPART